MSRSMHCVVTLPLAFVTVAGGSLLMAGCMAPESPDGRGDETASGKPPSSSEMTAETSAATANELDPTTAKMGEANPTSTAADIAGCNMYASITYADRNGFGEVACPYYADTLEVEACLEQLVTGGWETIDWTCADFSSDTDHHFVWTTTYQVPYWTNGRWYRTQVWARVNGGAWGYITSDGIQG